MGSAREDGATGVEPEARQAAPGDGNDAAEGPSTRPRKWRVGCALLPKKVSRYMTARIMEIAAEKDVELCLLDQNVPIAEQGPFHAIIHKLPRNQAWNKALLEYRSLNPLTRIVDQLEAVTAVQNRETMLNPLRDTLTFHPPSSSTCEADCSEPPAGNKTMRISSPLQVTISEGMTGEEAEALVRARGMAPPLLLKPLYADGRVGSHGLCLLRSWAALHAIVTGGATPAGAAAQGAGAGPDKPGGRPPGKGAVDVAPPMIVQPFVEHGGVLYKIYVLGSQIVSMKRPSLTLSDPDAAPEPCGSGIHQLPRISCTPHCGSGAGVGGGYAIPQHTEDMDPPGWMVRALGATLRARTGLQMFNVDMICPAREDSAPADAPNYQVVDINYFPGFDKIAGYERMFVHFLKTACMGQLPHADEGACVASPEHEHAVEGSTAHTGPLHDTHASHAAPSVGRLVS